MFQNLLENIRPESLSNKVASPLVATLLKKRLRPTFFSLNFGENFKRTFLQITLTSRHIDVFCKEEFLKVSKINWKTQLQLY